jgi:hypothetical protein
MRLIDMGTNCTMIVEILFDVPAGQGQVTLSRTATWPGVPLPGQEMLQGELEWPVSEAKLKIDNVQYDLEQHGEIACNVYFERWLMAKDLIQQGASSMLWAKYMVDPEQATREAVDVGALMTKKGFVESVSELIAYGWALYFGHAIWTPKDGKPELLRDDQFPHWDDGLGDYVWPD